MKKLFVIVLIMLAFVVGFKVGNRATMKNLRLDTVNQCRGNEYYIIVDGLTGNSDTYEGSPHYTWKGVETE